MTDNQQAPLDATGSSSDMSVRLGAASRAALHRGRFLRLAISGAIAVLSSAWIGWWALACWIAIVSTDRLILPALERIFVAPVSADRNRRQRRHAILRAIGSSVHCMPWAAAWAVGGDQAGFLAGMLLCGGFILALVYYAECRWLFMATIVPQIVISGALQALFQPQNLLPSMIVPALLIGTLRLVYARQGQLALFQAHDESVDGDTRVVDEDIKPFFPVNDSVHRRTLRSPSGESCGFQVPVGPGDSADADHEWKTSNSFRSADTRSSTRRSALKNPPSSFSHC